MKSSPTLVSHPTRVARGYVGRKPLSLRLQTSRGGRWTVNGIDQPATPRLHRPRPGFTPATNLLPLPPLALRTRQEAQTPAAYLPFPKTGLVIRAALQAAFAERIDYSRRTRYRATLRVTPLGAVAAYPGVFEMLSLR